MMQLRALAAMLALQSNMSSSEQMASEPTIAINGCSLEDWNVWRNLETAILDTSSIVLPGVAESNKI